MMIVPHFSEAFKGIECRFRIKHPSESLAGFSGVYALAIIEDFAIKAVAFEAANDLGCLDKRGVQLLSVIPRSLPNCPLALAVCVMKGSSLEFRVAAAKAFNDRI